MLLTTGNSAKLYCLNWIAAQADAQGGALSILDLGCGTSKDFSALLERYPQIRYVGIEPSPAACDVARRNLAGRQATIHTAYAYDVAARLDHETFDVVVSFSVLEHVYRREAYLASVQAGLKPDGRTLINYDAGHFVVPASWRERAKNVIGPLLAPLGIERYYQSFVQEADFRHMAAAAGLEIEEARSFNTHLKGVHKHIPASRADEHMQRWLDYELWLNSLDLPYEDRHARTWLTRNFILRRRSAMDI
jgi:SAM-dependent methyltransferase